MDLELVYKDNTNGKEIYLADCPYCMGGMVESNFELCLSDEIKGVVRR